MVAQIEIRKFQIVEDWLLLFDGLAVFPQLWASLTVFQHLNQFNALTTRRTDTTRHTHCTTCRTGQLDRLPSA